MMKNRRSGVSLFLAFCMPFLFMSGGLAGCVRQEKTSADSNSPLKLFVLADSHTGWNNPQQPDLNTQKTLVQNIMSAFPDLDAFVDCGDIFHKADDGSFPPETLQNTVDLFTNGTGNIPYFFSSGNHEIQSVDRNKVDPDEQISKLYNTSGITWYSFSLKNIHFVVLPEATGHVSYMDPKLLEWLKFDLKNNTGKTTMIFSHNAIRDTTDPLTTNPSDLYRIIYNSGEVVKILKEYKVAAWVHGHNHSFEILNRDGIEYVSAGRSGGFSHAKYRQFATAYLGGTYIEITKDNIVFKAYDGIKKNFIADINDPALKKDVMSGEIKGPTSLNSSVPDEMSVGALSRDGLKIPVYNNCYGENTSAQLRIGSTDVNYLNSDPKFAYFGDVPSDGRADIPGMTILEGTNFALGTKGPSGAKWLNPGIKLPASKAGYKINMTGSPGSTNNYRVVPGEKIKVKMILDAVNAKDSDKINMIYYMFDKNVRTIPKTQETLTKNIVSGKNGLEWVIDIPEFTAKDTIYEDLSSDGAVNLRITFNIVNHDAGLTITGLEVTPESGDAQPVTKDVSITYTGRSYKAEGELKDKIYTFDVPVPVSRETLEFSAKGNEVFVWSLTIKGIETQVKNAVVSKTGGGLRIDGIRNPYSRSRVILSSLVKSDAPRILELSNINKAEIKKFSDENKSLEIDVKELADFDNIPVSITVYSPYEIEKITGAVLKSTAGSVSVLEVKGTGRVEIMFK